MGLQERIILRFSRAPGTDDYRAQTTEWTVDGALAILEEMIPDFRDRVRGHRVLDFGCGAGYQAVALARDYDCEVVGLDTSESLLRDARSLAREYDIPETRLSFASEVNSEMLGGFDLVLSQNSFEHFGDPASILSQMRELIHDDGRIAITFGPPWFAPHGSHMHFFCRIPWLNLLFSERAVMTARKRFRDDGAMRYEDVESGLNKMTLQKFERIMAAGGVEPEYTYYRGVKRLDAVARIPILRELLVNQVTVIATKV